ncbi:MAG: glycosyltransferase family 2 protein [Bacteroidales bacterium]|nr:glycosyltransferase family 2 protein [Bacteroidales bacterium]
MVAVVIPCYRVKEKILPLLQKIGPEVQQIIVVDDACPEHTGEFVRENCTDSRVKVIIHPKNLGVGGAVKTGYKVALSEGVGVVVKLDGDGQMDPSLIPGLIEPLRSGDADYTKGNRFYDLHYLREMPLIRKIGNSFISFLNKQVSGYWDIMDPANGFTAITSLALAYLPLDKIDNRFFFENDMLFRLNTIRAVVVDFPMYSSYADEESNLRIYEALLKFPLNYLGRFVKRIFYNYFLRDFNIGSLELILGTALFLFGVIFGIVKWSSSILSSHPATAGTVLLAALPVIIGFQSLIAFLHFDLANIPRKPISTSLSKLPPQNLK